MDEGWVKWEWSAEKPYPLTMETRVDVERRYAGNHIEICLNKTVWYWSAQDDPSQCHWDQSAQKSFGIERYRVAQ